jgi:hemerythrin-like domain-containing protein
MKLIEELEREHARIDRVVGSMRTWADRAVAGDAPAADGRKFMRFFEVYAGGLHHEREETVLFPTTWNDLGLKADTPPIVVCIDDHHELAALLQSMKSLLEKKALATAEMREVQQLAIRYSHILWAHIDAENSVLFPEIELRLRHAGIRELPSRPMTADEESAAALGDLLIERYPPSDDGTIVRGEGCAMCPAYLAACSGIEREWWNEWEWEELDEHVAAS